MAESIPPCAPHRVREIDTPQGPARVYVVEEAECRQRAGTLLLGHGAGKGTNTPDLERLLVAADDGWRVILVDQPWVVAGRRVATRPPSLDEAWIAVVAALRAQGEVAGLLVQGGRSAGARVACRTARALGVDAVLALAFPLVPPGRREHPQMWRTAEAQAVVDAGIPLLVVQGATDAFGGPQVVGAAVRGARVAPVRGPHGFSKDPDDVVVAVRSWLRELPGAACAPGRGNAH